MLERIYIWGDSILIASKCNVDMTVVLWYAFELTNKNHARAFVSPCTFSLWFLSLN